MDANTAELGPHWVAAAVKSRPQKPQPPGTFTYNNQLGSLPQMGFPLGPHTWGGRGLGLGLGLGSGSG